MEGRMIRIHWGLTEVEHTEDKIGGTEDIVTYLRDDISAQKTQETVNSKDIDSAQ